MIILGKMSFPDVGQDSNPDMACQDWNPDPRETVSKPLLGDEGTPLAVTARLAPVVAALHRSSSSAAPGTPSRRFCYPPHAKGTRSRRPAWHACRTRPWCRPSGPAGPLGSSDCPPGDVRPGD